MTVVVVVVGWVRGGVVDGVSVVISVVVGLWWWLDSSGGVKSS